MWWACPWLQIQEPLCLELAMPRLSCGTCVRACADRPLPAMSLTLMPFVWVAFAMADSHLWFLWTAYNWTFCDEHHYSVLSIHFAYFIDCVFRVWIFDIELCFLLCIWDYKHTIVNFVHLSLSLASSSLMVTHLPLAQMMPLAGYLTCVQIRSWWFTHMTTSFVASPQWLSPRAAACCSLAMMTSTVMFGTAWRPTVQVIQAHSLALFLDGCKITAASFCMSLECKSAAWLTGPRHCWVALFSSPNALNRTFFFFITVL